METDNVRSRPSAVRWITDPLAVPVDELTGPKRLAALVARNLYWGRTHGWANLLEEHDWNLGVRIPRDLRKWNWRRRFGVEPGTARPVLLVGAQRSGTNMVTYALAMAPEFEVFNEGDRRAFANYRLRDRDHIAELARRSRHRFVLFKPLPDSHSTVQLLEELDTPTPPRALWVYRGVRGRVRSAVAKFGDSNLRVLRSRTADPGFRHWQLGGLSHESAALLDRFDPSELTPADGAALFWLIRNRLVFELGLHERDDVLLVSYDRFVASPEPPMRRICSFLDFPFDPSLVAHVGPRRPAPAEASGISEPILELCDELNDRLDRSLR